MQTIGAVLLITGQSRILLDFNANNAHMKTATLRLSTTLLLYRPSLSICLDFADLPHSVGS